MRPAILIPLHASAKTLPGVGERIQKALERLSLERVLDIVFHSPTGVLHHPLKSSLQECKAGEAVSICLTIQQHIPGKGRKPYEVLCVDSKGEFIYLSYFRAYESTLLRQLPVGAKRIIMGTPEAFMGRLQMVHPYKTCFPNQTSFQDKEATYPLTAGLSQLILQKIEQAALAKIPDLQEWLPATLLEKYNFLSWKESLAKKHHPQSSTDLLPSTPEHMRLALDELLAEQIAVGLARLDNTHAKGMARPATGELKRLILSNLSFSLTGSQKTALGEIEQDLGSGTRMMRLLQGDVGSGKTIVCLLAMIHTIEAYCQAALLAPTEILAQQHFKSISCLLKGTKLRCALLTGKIKGKKRQAIYDQLASGELHIIIGTHALIQERVSFKNLGLVVVDEQHRFGVRQRAALASKGDRVDVLITTATPIPRTLMLTSFGDLETSKLSEKPMGRQDILTSAMPLSKLDQVCERLGRILEKGEKLYWVCPLVEESEVLNLSTTQDRYEHLCQIYGAETVGWVHGKMSAEEKEAAMERFTSGKCQILVATTVIEVGVDVPEATVMIIEHAEHFGLSQLHQLRGRVGRNDKPCSCLLLYGHALSEIARRRLEIMRASNDGFRIAEEDLRLRGGGEVLGTRQSGLPAYKFADPFFHQNLLQEAYAYACMLLKNPRENIYSSSPQSQAIQTLLHLFDYAQNSNFLSKSA